MTIAKNYDYKTTIEGRRNLPFTEAEAHNIALGQGTSRIWLTDANSGTKNSPVDILYTTIQVIKDTVFEQLYDRVDYNKLSTDVDAFVDLAVASTGPFASITIPAGTILFGWFKNIKVTSGLICAYQVI